MNQFDPRLKKGAVIQTPYGIATVHDMMQLAGEPKVALEFWRDITQSDHTFANSIWPVEKCEFVAESDQVLIEILMEEYL